MPGVEQFKLPLHSPKSHGSQSVEGQGGQGEFESLGKAEGGMSGNDEQ